MKSLHVTNRNGIELCSMARYIDRLYIHKSYTVRATTSRLISLIISAHHNLFFGTNAKRAFSRLFFFLRKSKTEGNRSLRKLHCSHLISFKKDDCKLYFVALNLHLHFSCSKSLRKS